MERPHQLEADHLRHEHVERLAQHDRLGFDAPHPPADDSQAVDHSGVTIGSHQRVGEGDRSGRILAHKHTSGQILEIHLVHDADVGRHHAKIVKRLLSPAEELVTLAIALEVQGHVLGQRLAIAEEVHLYE